MPGLKLFFVDELAEGFRAAFIVVAVGCLLGAGRLRRIHTSSRSRGAGFQSRGRHGGCYQYAGDRILALQPSIRGPGLTAEQNLHRCRHPFPPSVLRNMNSSVMCLGKEKYGATFIC